MTDWGLGGHCGRARLGTERWVSISVPVAGWGEKLNAMAWALLLRNPPATCLGSSPLAKHQTGVNLVYRPRDKRSTFCSALSESDLRTVTATAGIDG